MPQSIGVPNTSMINPSSPSSLADRNLLWTIQKIHRCVDLAFCFRGEGELQLKVVEVVEAIGDAHGYAKFLTESITPEARADMSEEIIASLKIAEESLAYCFRTLISPDHPAKGAIANLREGRKAIKEVLSSIAK